MRCLVTGGTGFAGSSLVESLHRRGDQVAVLSRSGEPGPLAGVAGVQILQGDVADAGGVEAAIRAWAPEAIYHLAARTFVPDGQADRSGFLETNFLGTVNVLAAAAAVVPGCRVLVVGSAGEYGASGGGGEPLGEDAPLRPMEPYSASKAAAELWALQEAASSRLHVVCVRPFGHVGPRQAPRFAAPAFARQIGRIRAGEQPPVVEVGNLEPVREFNDVEDIVAGHLAALEKGRPGRVYNLCSGKGVSVRDLLLALLERAGVEAEIRVCPERVRPADVPALVGDPSRSREELGWEAGTPLEATLDCLLARWGALERRLKI